MVKQVVLVESDHIARQVNTVLNKHSIDSCAIGTSGHLFKYQSQSGKYALTAIDPYKVQQIQALNGKNLIIATDPDPQGHLIAEHIKALTPKSTHERRVLNDASEMGVLRTMRAQSDMGFNDNSALKAALGAIINLRMKERDPNDFVTTTSIEIAKQHSIIGQVQNVRERRFLVDGLEHSIITPKQLSNPIQCEKPKPFTSKIAVTDNALSERSMNVMANMQLAFIQGRLSYSRTTSHALPSIAEQVLASYTLDGELADNQDAFIHDQLVAHYAIYNLAPAQSTIEHYIKALNRSALMARDNGIAKFTFEGGMEIHSRIIKGQVDSIPPANQLAFLLAQSKESSPASIEASAHLYAKHFFNGNWKNEKLLTKTLHLAEKHYPSLLENGLNQTLDNIVADLAQTADKKNALSVDKRVATEARMQHLDDAISMHCR